MQLQSAIEVQPLTKAQIQRYLATRKHSLEAVRTILDQNPILQELLTAPLFLSATIQAYQGKTKNDLPQTGTPEEQQHQIFAGYIQRVLERPVARERFTQEQTRHWLTWLAQQMQHHQLTEFYLEHLSSSWLPMKPSQKWYLLPAESLSGLIGGSAFGLFLGLVVGLISGIAAGPLIGLSFGLLGILIYGLLFGLLGLLVGLAGGLSSTLLPGLSSPSVDMQPTEIISWSWRRFLQGVGVALLVGLASGLNAGPLAGLGITLFVILGWMLLFGFLETELDQPMRARPNQGIHLSGWNALRAALLFGLLFGLFFGFTFGMSDGPHIGLFAGLLFGPLAGFFAGLRYGEGACPGHYTLRLLLWRRGAMPWCYIYFLEEASKRTLLHRVGGGYCFSHPLFQEYFASGAATASPAAPSA